MSRFADTYGEGRRLGTGGPPPAPEPVGAFLRQHHGREFGAGLYRVHDSESVAVFGAGEPPAWEACIGYRVPLFLGGSDEVGNLEEVDLDVYWSLTAQIWRGATR